MAESEIEPRSPDAQFEQTTLPLVRCEKKSDLYDIKINLEKVNGI